MESDQILKVKGISKTFGRLRAVDGLSFSVRRATITGLLGRNGAGKTTTLRMVNGIFLPDAGSVEVLGSSDVAAVRDAIGYLPEERGLYRKMRVLDQLLFLAEIKGCRRAEARAGAERWLTRFELWDKRACRLEELSKGNQQKVQIVGALLHDPQLVILDEPMSGLDPVNVVLVREMLRELKREGRAILLSTHMMAEAERLVDDIVLLHQGRAVLSGSLADVQAAHGADTVRLAFEGDGRFLMSVPGVVWGRVEGGRAELRVAGDADPQCVLEAAMPQLRVTRFEVARPSLEEIFMAAVGADAPPEAEVEMLTGSVEAA